jgi:acyl-coenzyme A thioesterase PaaI-like protein
MCAAVPATVDDLIEAGASSEGFNRIVIAGLVPRLGQMGIRVVELRRGFVRAEVPLEGNGNHLGTMYAGTLFAIGEMLGGVIALSSFDAREAYPIVKAVKISFRRAARGTVTAEASMSEAQIAEVGAALEAHGRAPFTLPGRLYDAAGELVAETEGEYQLRVHGS